MPTAAHPAMLPPSCCTLSYAAPNGFNFPGKNECGLSFRFATLLFPTRCRYADSLLRYADDDDLMERGNRGTGARHLPIEPAEQVDISPGQGQRAADVVVKARRAPVAGRDAGREYGVERALPKLFNQRGFAGAQHNFLL